MAIKAKLKTQVKKATPSVSKLKNTAKGINEFMIETTEVMVDETIKSTSKWQAVGQKAIKGGLKLADNQQDLVFTALEMTKKQLITGSAKLISIFSKN